jgi:glycosyltransferase involved in cell wall biosynthesis
MTKPADAVTIVIPVHNAADRLDRVAGWRMSMEKSSRPFRIIVVDDGSTDVGSAKLAGATHTSVMRHETRRGFGACLRTALAETTTPLFFYTSLDYPYTPSDIRPMLERITLRDEILGKQPDLISGCRTGLDKPGLVKLSGRAWRLFWRIVAGMPIADPPPWHGWAAYRYRVHTRWVYGVPLSDVNSCFKLFRTDFLKRFPIQSDGDFVHTELVAKATFLTSIMDEVPLTPKPDPIPALGDVRADRRRVFGDPLFAFPPEPARPPSPPLPDPAPAPTT